MLALTGTGIGDGVAIGKALVLDRSPTVIPEYLLAEETIDDEVDRFEKAVQSARHELKRIQNSIPKDAPPETFAFIDVHLLMLTDPVLVEEPIKTIRERRHNPEWALEMHAEKLVAFFDAIEDPYLRSKREDVLHVVDRIQAELQQERKSLESEVGESLEGYIVVANDLTPADAVSLKHRYMSAFVTNLGGPISHTAILARSLGVPAVVGLHGAIQFIKNDDLIVIDGPNDTVLINCDDTIVGRFLEERQRVLKRKKALDLIRGEEAVTEDGVKVTLLANIEFPEDIKAVRAVDADGVGLYRTEFLFMNRPEPPGEDEQFEAYSHVLTTLDSPVTVRTLDLGADKQVDGGRADGEATINPALGLRAVRLCLSEPALFKPQLRAIFRASAFGKIKIMIPMLSSLSELEQVLELIREVKRELSRESVQFDPEVPVGGMIEVPAAAIAADLFAKKLDFLSIGTNDLIQYTLAIDRIDDEVNYLYDPLHPSVIRLIQNVIDAGSRAGIPVSMCGEMAGDSTYTRLLLGLGLREFSMDASVLLEIKQIIRSAQLESLSAPLSKLLETSDPGKILALVDAMNQSKTR